MRECSSGLLIPSNRLAGELISKTGDQQGMRVAGGEQLLCCSGSAAIPEPEGIGVNGLWLGKVPECTARLLQRILGVRGRRGGGSSAAQEALHSEAGAGGALGFGTAADG